MSQSLGGLSPQVTQEGEFDSREGASESAATRRVRLCYLLESFHPVFGGGETQGLLTLRELVRQGAEVLVITRRVLPDSPQEEDLCGGKVLRIGPSGLSMSAGRWLMLVTAFFRLLRERRRFDVIFVDGFRTLGLVAVAAARLTGKRVVFKPNSSGEMSGAFFDRRLRRLGLSSRHWLLRWAMVLRNRVLAAADAFCPVSSDIAREFLEAGVAPEKISLIPNAYDERRFLPAPAMEKLMLRKEMGIPTDCMVAVFTGRLVSYKGPQHLVRMWPRILQRHGGPSLLYLVGPSGNDIFDCAAEIHREIERLGLRDSIRMTGAVTNVEDYLKAADLFLFPSQEGEGLPTSVIEAMACGLPCVSTRATGLNDLMTPEIGIAVEPSDLDGFAEGVLKLMGDSGLRVRLGEAAASRARSLYAAERVNRQYLEIFQGSGGMKVVRETDPEELLQGTTVILSPHMDDGELGCGGTIGRLACKERVHVVYVTDGTRSPAPALRPAASGLGAIRRQEARNAMGVLGVPEQNIHFLDFPEGRLREHGAAVEAALSQLLRKLGPAHLFAPFRYDRHPDHLEVHKAARALVRNRTVAAEMYEYFIYYRTRLLPRGDIRAYIRPDCLTAVEIAPEAKRKRMVLNCHLSQVTKFYPWQLAPVLSASLLEEFCSGPELFVTTGRAPEGAAVFTSARPWIRLAHKLEPILKRNKDKFRLIFHPRVQTR